VLLLLLCAGIYFAYKSQIVGSESSAQGAIAGDIAQRHLVVKTSEPKHAVTVAELNYGILPEASGLAVSGIDPQRLWLVNDSGGRSELVALDLGNEKFRRVNIRKARNRDWEDLEVFEYQGIPWIVIADVGDNEAVRTRVQLYFLPEPAAKDRRVVASTTITLSYPDGPRDVESVAVDPQTATLYLLSKREPYPRLYALALPDLTADKAYRMEAKLLGEVRSIPAPTAADLKQFPMYGENRSRPTGMAHVPNGSGIALLTYGKSYFAALGPDRDWLTALNNTLCPIVRPELQQAESIAADTQGYVYVTSEGKNAPVLKLKPAADCLLDHDGG